MATAASEEDSPRWFEGEIMAPEEINAMASIERFKALLDDFADSTIELTGSIDAVLLNPKAQAMRKRLSRLRPKLGVLARATVMLMEEIKPPVPGRMN